MKAEHFLQRVKSHHAIFLLTCNAILLLVYRPAQTSVRVEKREFTREFRQLSDAFIKRGLIRVSQWSWPANKYY